MLQRLVPVHDWAAAQAHHLPRNWRALVLGQWARQSNPQGKTWTEQAEAERQANVQLREVCASLGTVSEAGLPLDATDAELCDRAEALAADCFALASIPWNNTVKLLRAAMARKVRGCGLQPPKDEGEKRPGRVIEDGPAVARMTDPQWWRRGLRKLQAKAVEGAAIRLGVVSRARAPYVSDESLARRLQQNERNAATLAATVARNDAGQEYTLAELAAKGPANKGIRRAELMTRIAGFERIAREMAHAGLFLTITCPSRMHRWRTVNGGARVIENPRYDGTNPREANEYLGKVWARIRAALARLGVRLYGFRIAEPQHDGTPHWHFLVFHPAPAGDEVRRIVRKYALADSPGEPGAHTHRCDFKAIDWSRGSAAGYIAKYVAKNIDGYRVDKDLLGNDAMETSARVEAWAATWRIRQFQQIGGAPVGVWRELRRVETVPEGAPEYLQAAHRAVNKVAVLEGRDNACVAWDHYTQAQGGVFCGRAARIKLAKQEQEGTGRYGDALGERVIGVETAVRELYSPDWNPTTQAHRLVHWVVESARRTWTIVGRRVDASTTAPHAAVAWDSLEQFKRRGPPAAPELIESDLCRAREVAAAIAAKWKSDFAKRAQPAQPRTCVNNCTEGGRNDAGNGSQAAGGHEGLCEHPADGESGHRAHHQTPVRAAGAAGAAPSIGRGTYH